MCNESRRDFANQVILDPKQNHTDVQSSRPLRSRTSSEHLYKTEQHLYSRHRANGAKNAARSAVQTTYPQDKKVKSLTRAKSRQNATWSEEWKTDLFTDPKKQSHRLCFAVDLHSGLRSSESKSVMGICAAPATIWPQSSSAFKAWGGTLFSLVWKRSWFPAGQRPRTRRTNKDCWLPILLPDLDEELII